MHAFFYLFCSSLSDPCWRRDRPDTSSLQFFFFSSPDRTSWNIDSDLDPNDSILDQNDSKDSVLGLNLDLEMSESEKIFVHHTLDACQKRKKKYSEMNRTAAMQLIQDKKTSHDDDDDDDLYVKMLLNDDGVDGMNVFGEEEDGNVEEMLLLEKKEKMRIAMEALSSDK